VGPLLDVDQGVSTSTRALPAAGGPRRRPGRCGRKSRFHRRPVYSDFVLDLNVDQGAVPPAVPHVDQAAAAVPHVDQAAAGSSTSTRRSPRRPGCRGGPPRRPGCRGDDGAVGGVRDKPNPQRNRDGGPKKRCRGEV